MGPEDTAVWERIPAEVEIEGDSCAMERRMGKTRSTVCDEDMAPAPDEGRCRIVGYCV